MPKILHKRRLAVFTSQFLLNSLCTLYKVDLHFAGAILYIVLSDQIDFGLMISSPLKLHGSEERCKEGGGGGLAAVQVVALRRVPHRSTVYKIVHRGTRSGELRGGRLDRGQVEGVRVVSLQGAQQLQLVLRSGRSDISRDPVFLLQYFPVNTFYCYYNF